MTNIVKHIENQGPILSGDLARHLEISSKITNIAARKAIERLKSPIHKLTGLFQDKQSLIYHQSQYQSDEYFDALYESLKSSGKRYYALICAINYHNGLISIEQLKNYSFSPTTNKVGHIHFDTLIENALKNRILEYYDEQHLSINKRLLITDLNFKLHKAIEFSKKYTLSQFANWGKNIGMFSFGSAQFNSNISGFNFALTAPTYINGLIHYDSKGKPQPGFLVADILIGEKVTVDYLSFFIQKINIITRINSKTKILPILILENTDQDALNIAKSNGVVIGFVNEIFGENYALLLKNLISTLSNAGTILKNNPEQFVELLSKLTKLVDGKTNNLKGDLFEFGVGFYYSQHCQYIELGKNITTYDPYDNKEIDILAIDNNILYLVECKGTNYPIDVEYIETYLKINIPSIRSWVKSSTYKDKEIIFEFWSINGFTEDALELLNNYKNKTKKIKLNYFDRNNIIEKTKSLSSNKFKKIINEYFLKEI